MGAWPARPIQRAAAKLYRNTAQLEKYFDDLDKRIQDRMSILKSRLGAMQNFGVNYVEPEGGIYLSTQFDLFELLDCKTNEEIRTWLLKEAGVAVVPFQAFGLEADTGWFRISIGAVSVEDIVAAMNRLESALMIAYGHEHGA
jgi:aspartate aminotransferase